MKVSICFLKLASDTLRAGVESILSLGVLKRSTRQVISDAAQKEVMAWQFAKQQGQIALEADETDCTTSTWADPSLLKQSLSGLSRVCIQ